MSGKGGWPWEVLGLPGRPATLAEVKRAYARRLKAIDQATDIAGFEDLRGAYEAAQRHRYAPPAPRTPPPHTAEAPAGERLSVSETGFPMPRPDPAEPSPLLSPRSGQPEPGGTALLPAVQPLRDPPEAQPEGAASAPDPADMVPVAPPPAQAPAGIAAQGAADIRASPEVPADAGPSNTEAPAPASTRPEDPGEPDILPKGDPSRDAAQRDDGEEEDDPLHSPEALIADREAARNLQVIQALLTEFEQPNILLSSETRLAALLRHPSMTGHEGLVRKRLAGWVRRHLTFTGQRDPLLSGELTPGLLRQLDARFQWLSDFRAFRRDFGPNEVLQDLMLERVHGPVRRPEAPKPQRAGWRGTLEALRSSPVAIIMLLLMALGGLGRLRDEALRTGGGTWLIDALLALLFLPVMGVAGWGVISLLEQKMPRMLALGLVIPLSLSFVIGVLPDRLAQVLPDHMQDWAANIGAVLMLTTIAAYVVGFITHAVLDWRARRRKKRADGL